MIVCWRKEWKGLTEECTWVYWEDYLTVCLTMVVSNYFSVQNMPILTKANTDTVEHKVNL